MTDQNSLDGVRARLQQAALELFRERGYDRTTAAAIAARVGVTERTFFRHFPDKRETLFGGEAVLRPALTEAVAAASSGLAPLDLLFQAFRSLVPLLEANRSFAVPRQAVVSSTPALHERELAKQEALADALAAALRARGVAEQPALLAARIGMAAFTHATIAWLDTPEPDLSERLDLALQDLRTLLGNAGLPNADRSDTVERFTGGRTNGRLSKAR